MSDIITFYVYPSKTLFFPQNPYNEKLIDSIVSFRPKGYIFSEKYKSGLWDGWYKFRHYNKIPTGLYMALIKPTFEKMSIKYKEVWKFEYIEAKNQQYQLIGVEDRDYQKNIIDEAIKIKRCVIKLPTNAGKTEVALALIQAYDKPFIFITHKKVLFYQTYERIANRLGFTPALVGDGKLEYNYCKGALVMIQTLTTMKDKLLKDKLLELPILIVDELHHYSGKTWFNVLSASKSIIRYGLTATPVREDEVRDWQLVALTGSIIGDITNKFMIEKGYSAAPCIYMVDIPKQYTIYSGYRDAYKKLIIENPERYKVIKKLVEINKGKQVLICVDRIEQGNRLKEILPGSVFIKGNHTIEEGRYNMEVISKFKKKEISCVISTLLDEGFDNPNIEVLIFASPMKGIVRVLQRIGRGMRKADNKNVVIVYDLVDQSSTYFIRQAREREKIYRNEGFNIIKKNDLL